MTSEEPIDYQQLCQQLHKEWNISMNNMDLETEKISQIDKNNNYDENQKYITNK